MTLGGCNSYQPMGCEIGYASSDIFYQEVCVYDAICANRESLWKLKPKQLWRCDLEYEGLRRFAQALL